jgi:glutathione S-transferase
MSNITLYQYEISPFCDKVRRTLKLKGQAFKTENISLLQTQLGKVKKLGPAAKLPVLEIDGERISDSSNIVAELEKRFPTPAIYPTDKKQQALVHFFEDWSDESLYFFEVYLRFVRNPKEWGKITSKEDHPAFAALSQHIAPGVLKKQVMAQGLARKTWAEIEGDLHKHFQSLSDWLEDQHYLCGDELTLADISVAAQISCIIGTPEGQRIAAKYPSVQDWLERTNQLTI